MFIDKLGFIITRNVISNITNEYWNNNVKLIRTLYPTNKIVIIDDNSNKDHIHAHQIYQNVEIIQSEYPGRGELLPYYYVKYKWFEKAIILHDGVFINTHVNFENIQSQCISLWHADKHMFIENLPNIKRLTNYLKHGNKIYNLNNCGAKKFTFRKFKPDTIICFGAQCFITLKFAEYIENKYSISNLLNVILTRKDRCSFERIIGAIIITETSNEHLSIFGDIMKHHKKFTYNWSNYINDIKNNIVRHPIIKIWSGR